MPRARQPSGYPGVFRKMIEAVSNTSEPFFIATESKRKAELIRFQIYSFVKACRSSKNPIERDLGEVAYGLVFSVSHEGITVTLRDNEADALSISDQLDAHMDKLAQEGKVPGRPQAPGTSPQVPGVPSSYTMGAAEPKKDELEDMVAKFMTKGIEGVKK